ncbi:hypothetical protein KA005_27665 [bacterium]|nr:hypothetical protein [bacterium]
MSKPYKKHRKKRIIKESIMKKTHSKSWFEFFHYDFWNDFNNEPGLTILQIKEMPDNYILVEVMNTKDYKGGNPC